MRESRRAIQRGVRQLDRETVQMRSEEKKLLEGVRKEARLGDMSALSATAKQLVQIRASINRNTGVQNKMKAVDQRFADVKACTIATDAMKALTGCMMTMQRDGLDVAGMSMMVRDFERANGVMDANIEMIDEAVGDMIEPGENDEEDTRNIVESMLAEVGLDIVDVLASAPVPGSSKNTAVQDLDNRLMMLKL